ncbi:hypothetical protein BGX34_009837 [Mortierella sp. NVP85]|nr:hypothetical protein BGX34_009837 [Mortierella sp. NVP85]
MRMLDEQRAAQLAAQQQQQQQQKQQEQQEEEEQAAVAPPPPPHQQQQQPQQQKQQQEPKQQFRPIQRHYQPHQQMYPVHSQPVPIKPYPQQPTPSQLKQSQALRAHPYHSQQRLTQQQQQILQRYQQQRQAQQKQQQLRQLQYLRNRQAASNSTQKSSHGMAASQGSHSSTPPRLFGSQVDRPIKKTTKPPECSNCLALDSLTWKPKAGLQSVTQDSLPLEAPATTAEGASTSGSKVLCSTCSQYLQTHGNSRPVPPFRTNFLKKIHTRFKRELQEVRFQGWQDAQVLEIEDRMSEREFQIVFNGVDEGDPFHVQIQQSSASGSPASSTQVKAFVTDITTCEVSTVGTDNSGMDPADVRSDKEKEKEKEREPRVDTSSTVQDPGVLVIKIEDDDVAPATLSKPENVEVRTYQSEASMGELFGHRWRTEPVVGYTLVHFGGSDRTRMVPMNPTVPSLTVTFNRSEETITFAFRVLVNGLCLLSSGGGPPALHMPEMADDDESEDEEDVVVVPDNDKDDPSPSPPAATASAAPTEAKNDTTPTAGGATGPTPFDQSSGVGANMPPSQDH